MIRVLLPVALLLGCGGVGGVGGDDVSGELTVRSDLYGEWTVTPRDCVSGEHQLFFGADLIDDADGADLVRVVLDPLEGYALALNVPGEELSFVLRAEDGCERFDLRVARDNVRVNNIWEIGGHVRVTCRLPDLELTGELEFAGCF